MLGSILIRRGPRKFISQSSFISSSFQPVRESAYGEIKHVRGCGGHWSWPLRIVVGRAFARAWRGAPDFRGAHGGLEEQHAAGYAAEILSLGVEHIRSGVGLHGQEFLHRTRPALS